MGLNEHRRRLPTQLHRIYRVCERFQNWLPSPFEFYGLNPEDQARLLAYEIIREAEEAELSVSL